MVQQTIVCFKQNFSLPALHFQNLGRRAYLFGPAKYFESFQNCESVRLECQPTRNTFRAFLPLEKDCRDSLFLEFYRECECGYTGSKNHNVSSPVLPLPS